MLFALGVLIAFNKPYGVLSQFTPDGSKNRNLSEFGFPKRVYPIGRLDADSEGLLLLSGESEWNDRVLNPKRRHPREYWAQVERIPADDALRRLSQGVTIKGYRTLPCRTWKLERKTVADIWIGLELVEGKNRQVRRMTAAIGHPTLRLLRVRIGQFQLPSGLGPGEWRELKTSEKRLLHV